MTRWVSAGMAAGWLMLLTPWPATAQEQQASWNKSEITPYLWAVGIKGDVTVAGRDVDVDVGFDDLLDKIDAGGSLLGAFQFNRWILMGQIDYLALGTDAEGPAGGRGDLDTTSTIGTVAFGYRFEGWTPEQTFDVLFGVRQLSLDNELSLEGVAGTFERDQDFTDGVIVLGGRFPLSERWRLYPLVSYGTGDSDSVWDIWPQFRYTLSDNWLALIGYRWLHYDVEGDRDNAFDAAFHGFTLGLGATF